MIFLWLSAKRRLLLNPARWRTTSKSLVRAAVSALTHGFALTSRDSATQARSSAILSKIKRLGCPSWGYLRLESSSNVAWQTTGNGNVTFVGKNEKIVSDCREVLPIGAAMTTS